MAKLWECLSRHTATFEQGRNERRWAISEGKRLLYPPKHNHCLLLHSGSSVVTLIIESFRCEPSRLAVKTLSWRQDYTTHKIVSIETAADSMNGALRIPFCTVCRLRGSGYKDSRIQILAASPRQLLVSCGLLLILVWAMWLSPSLT